MQMQHDKMQHVFFDAVTLFDFRLVRSSLFTISNCWPSYSVSFPARPIFTFHHVRNETCNMTHAFWPDYIFRFWLKSAPTPHVDLNFTQTTTSPEHQLNIVSDIDLLFSTTSSYYKGAHLSKGDFAYLV